MNMFGQLMKNKSGKSLEILSEKLEVVRAPEPSNIVWENLHMTPRKITMKNIIVMAIVTIFLAIVFSLITFLKVESVKTESRYPPLTNCVSYNDLFQKED